VEFASRTFPGGGQNFFMNRPAHPVQVQTRAEESALIPEKGGLLLPFFHG
jgi:hypothetical protein